MSEDQTTGNESSQDTGNENQSDVFSREYVQELREENRQRRLELRQLQDQFTELANRLPSQEEEVQHDNPVDALAARVDTLHQTLEQERTMRLQAELNATRQALAREFNLPEVLAARIQGDNLEAMRADAEALASIVPNNSQSDTQETDLPETPDQEAAIRYRNRIRRTTGLPGGQAFANQDANRRNRYFGK